jgi:hypothetical protein
MMEAELSAASKGGRHVLNRSVVLRKLLEEECARRGIVEEQ